MEVLSPEVNGHGPYGSPNPAADSGLVVPYLSDLLEVTLGASRQDLEESGSLLGPAYYNDTLQRCTRFASEPQVALYVRKDYVKAESSNGHIETSGL